MTMDACQEPIQQPVLRTERKRGFTLTEIAIVLGIIGLILGAIWVAAAAVYNNLHISKATTELVQITQAIRSFYASGTALDTNADMTFVSPQTHLTYIQAGIFPSDTLNTAKTWAADPWNGALSVQSSTYSSAADSFGVLFDAVPQAACITFINSNVGTSRDPNMYGVTTAAAGTVPTAPTVGTPAYSATGTATSNKTFALAAAQVATACGATTNALAFWFTLR